MHSSSPIRASFLVPSLMLAGALAGCQQEPNTVDRNAIENVVATLPRVPRPDPPIDRASLLAAVVQAASATAAGAPASSELRALAGRRFELRIRFGCRGPSTDLRNEWLGWSFDAETRTVRLRARPTISEEEPLLAHLGEGEFEAVEGFWIPRPWLLQPVCPATAAIDGSTAGREPAQADAESDEPVDQPSEPVPTAPRVGIAQFFTSTESRTGRRDGRAYEAVHTLKEGEAVRSQGFNLVIAGRLRALPGRNVIECVASSAANPPECIISAEVERAWIEQPETRDVIAEWGGG